MNPLSKLLLVLQLGVTLALQTLPPLNWSRPEGSTFFRFRPSSRNVVYISATAAAHRDRDGLTLIPPSGLEFAKTFAKDLSEIFAGSYVVKVTKTPPTDGIYMTMLGDRSWSTYKSGKVTSEGYQLDVGRELIVIRGAGARGIWWGTRSLLQEFAIARKSSVEGDVALRTGSVRDAPAYPTRGFMLDAGRKWYSKLFLKELCTYASFFKFSEFHYHISDNYPLNRGQNETWQMVHSQFSLYPENPDLRPLITKKNETLSREDFEELQSNCAQRGITIIPEIEAPGHALAITKWKHELALAKKDLLNLTHPDAIPTVKAIWDEFLPWFQTKQVHIGADEYDPSLANDYITFVNEMNAYIRKKSGKRIRIWGTNEPSEDLVIDKDVIIQHWQYGQSDPVKLANAGYDIINSEDWWGYISIKNDHTPIFPATYPQFFNVTRTLNFANKPGWQWEPSLFNPFNISDAYQLPKNSTRNLGAISASWNDNGPAASTQLEAYYGVRDGLPITGSRAWSGGRGPDLEVDMTNRSVTLLSSVAPGQNLDRNIRSTSKKIIDWGKGQKWPGKGSKGMNYTISITYSGPFTLSSSDVVLSLLPNGTLEFSTDGFHYSLREIDQAAGYDPSHPGRIWSNSTSSSHKEVVLPRRGKLVLRTDKISGTRAWNDEGFKGRFEVFVYGGRNTLFSWSQMAFVAPLAAVKGALERIEVWDAWVKTTS